MKKIRLINTPFSLKFFIVLLFISAFLIRGFFFLTFLKDNPCMLLFDSKHYHELALYLTKGLGFVDAQGAPYFYRLPGYSLFLAACYKITSFSVIATLMIQVFFSSLIPMLIYWLSLILLPSRYSVAVVASIIACFHVGFIIFSGVILTETLFLVFWLLFLLCFYRATSASFGAAGVLLGLASLIRPVTVPLILCVLVTLFLMRISVHHRLMGSCVLIAGWLSIIGWWLLRNFLLTGYLFFHTLSGPHFLNHVATRLVADCSAISYEQAKVVVSKELNEAMVIRQAELGHTLSDIEFCIVAEHLAIQHMLRAPLASLRLFIENMFKTTFSLYSSELLFIGSGGLLPMYDGKRSVKDWVLRFLYPKVHNNWIRSVIYFEIFLWLLLLVGFLGFLWHVVLSGTWRLFLVQGGLFIGLFIFISLACGYARLRIPIEPFLIIYAVSFWIDFFGVKGKDA